MVTKRRPIYRPPRVGYFSERALVAFRKMQALEDQCRCKPIDWGGKYWEHKPCRACEAWWAEHSILSDELRFQPWDWPAIERPAAASPYPRGSYADRIWKPHPEAQARYRALAEAVAKAAEPANA